MEWSDHALALFRERAIDPDVAASAGVTEAEGQLVYPTGKRRPLNGNGGPPHLHPEGKPLGPWWVTRADGSTVLITEGETDGLAALTALEAAPNPFAGTPILALPGCSYSPDTLARGLADKYRMREAYLALDADEAGRRAQTKIAQALEARGIRAIPVELPDGYDLASYLATQDDVAQVFPNMLADAEPAYTRQRQGISFADIEDEPVQWLWRQRVVRDRPTVVAADPGMGKSTWTCVLAAELSRGGMTVLMANAEDPPPRVRERLIASGADLTNVRPVDGLVLPDQTKRLREQAIETNADLIVIDPYNAYLADGVNALRDQQVRGALAPLLAIGKEVGCGIVIVCHLNRGGEEENPIYRIPVGVRGIAGSILMMQVDGDTQLLHRKSSYGPLQEAIHYRFDNGRLVEVGGGVPSPTSAGESQRPAAPDPSELPSIDTLAEQAGLEIVKEYDD